VYQPLLPRAVRRRSEGERSEPKRRSRTAHCRERHRAAIVQRAVRPPCVVVTCPENPEPVVMRVFGVQGTQEALDEAEEARSGRDHPEVA